MPRYHDTSKDVIAYRIPELPITPDNIVQEAQDLLGAKLIPSKHDDTFVVCNVMDFQFAQRGNWIVKYYGRPAPFFAIFKHDQFKTQFLPAKEQ